MNFLRKISNLIPHNSRIRTLYSRLKGVLAFLIAKKYKNLIIIGITGTDGKTTTSIFLHDMLSQLGKKTALACGQEFRIANQKFDNTTKRTTSSPFFLWSFLKKAHTAGCTHIVLEISSHGLSQWRDYGIQYDGCIVTNLTQEHGDYHPTMEDYASVKAMLCKKVHTAYQKKSAKKTGKQFPIVLGSPLQCHEIFESIAPNQTFRIISDKNTKSTSTLNEKNIFQLSCNEHYGDRTNGILQHENKKRNLSVKQIGEHTVWNFALCVLLLHKLGGWKIEEILHSCKDITQVPGRLELVAKKNNKYYFVDFGVTPQALLSVLQSLQKIGHGKVTLVFGATGGQHDHKKRSSMGKVAVEHANSIIFTEDESYGEDIKDIFSDVTKELTQKQKDKIHYIPDRGLAIKTAIEKLDENGVLVVTGMGDLKSRNQGGIEISRSDKDCILANINQQ